MINLRNNKKQEEQKTKNKEKKKQQTKLMRKNDIIESPFSMYNFQYSIR